MSEIKKKWYVVRAVSGKEKKVKEYLELEISRHKLNDFVKILPKSSFTLNTLGSFAISIFLYIIIYSIYCYNIVFI